MTQNRGDKRNPLQRAASSVARLFGRRESEETAGEIVVGAPEIAPVRTSPPAQQARPTKRESDIPIERAANAYVPPQTSLKTSFRSDGADRHRDQDIALGRGSERWNDEDRFTNKSGDPRIGTHGRTYEPGETESK